MCVNEVIRVMHIASIIAISIGPRQCLINSNSPFPGKETEGDFQSRVSSRAAAELEAAWDSTSPFLLREDNCYTSKHHPRDPDNRASGTGAIKERWVLITKCSLV